MEDNLVVQSNDLVVASYTMTTREKELLLACISQVDSRPDAPNINKQTKFTITIDEVKRLFYGDSNAQNIYRDIEQASNRLFDREVTIELPANETLRTRFVSSVLFSPDLGQVRLTFAEEILPYLTQLKANFTKYKLLEISELSSIHAIRLYELIICWLGQYQYSKTYELDDFKYIMGVSGKYQKFSQLKSRVIETAITEINESTNYNISVDFIKKSRGKGYKGLTLKFHRKTLDKLAGENGLSPDTIRSIVDNPQFMNDYNDHKKLSHQGRMDVKTFKDEMFHIIQIEPESFDKKGKGLESYLPKVKQGE
ncbi:replication initiation protein [Pseudoalteromonas sp.]|uniref:replication initiation protein n=1 Tax=Pseudoalteromonas sp. TaxID=53249 RepID=UPI00257DDB58|nr:replication initiation protein [Pseudoalteromonas sp.]